MADKNERDANIFAFAPRDSILEAKAFRERSLKARIKTAGKLHDYRDKAKTALKRQLTAYFKRETVLRVGHRRSSVAMFTKKARGLTETTNYNHAFGMNFLQFLADHPNI